MGTEMKTPLGKVRRASRRLMNQASRTVDHVRGTHRLIRADFNDGGRTMHAYLRTHKTRYMRHVGAHFLMELYRSGPDVLSGFAARHSDHGWHFRLTDDELEALRKARNATCATSRISRLRYTTNIFNHITNRKQLGRMLGLGVVAGSAGILLSLSELFFFAKEYTRDLLSSTLGLTWIDTAQAHPGQNAQFVDLARKITDGAVGSDGSLDPDIVAARVSDLVETMKSAGDPKEAVAYMTADTSYIIGIISGIVLLVIGRGIVQLVVEGFSGTAVKIDALVRDMDAYCDWKIGRSPFPSDIDPARLDGPLPAQPVGGRPATQI